MEARQNVIHSQRQRGLRRGRQQPPQMLFYTRCISAGKNRLKLTGGVILPDKSVISRNTFPTYNLFNPLPLKFR